MPNRKGLALGARFLVAFLVVSAVVRVAVPANPDYPWHPSLTVKLDHLRTTDEHYDVVVVGDSRAFRAIDPVLMSEELEQLGCPASVYNLGTVAMSKMEFDHTMEVLEDIPGGTPEVVVVVDTLPILAGLLKDFSVRQRVHMTAGSASEYIRYRALLPEEDFGTDQLEVLDTALGFAVNQIPVGVIHQQLFDQAPLEDQVALATENLGFQPWPDFYAEAGDEGIANLWATLEPELSNGGWEERWRDEDPSEDRLRRWVEAIAQHVEKVPEGSSPVQVFVPSYYDAGTLDAIVDAVEAEAASDPEFAARIRDAVVTNLVDDARVGDYTDPSFFIDYWHLSESGGDATTRALAEVVCPTVSARVEG